MQSSSFFNPLITPTGTPFSGKPRHPKPLRLSNNRLKSMAFKKDGKMVDDNMIVLRERIRKIEAETEYNDIDDQFPDNMMQWEKTYINNGGYHSDVYEAVAFLQRFLMESRPSVALGLRTDGGFRIRWFDWDDDSFAVVDKFSSWKLKLWDKLYRWLAKRSST